ncbi:MAG: hypothetical protein QG639_1020, partial [Patescibacteria group bacterium]|nr:hypothetical protein [Patescibacteria group bacterium]
MSQSFNQELTISSTDDLLLITVSEKRRR